MGYPSDTIAALGTPVGTAALAVIRVSGPACAELSAIVGGNPPPPRVATHGDYHARDGWLVDDVVATFFKGPQSYTGEDSLEISCHGNPLIAQTILEDLYARGCHPAEAGEFTRRAFLNGRMDLSQAEAVMDLIHARSERALAAANQQLRGSLGRHLSTLTEAVLQVLARVEAYIDFPDEDLPAEDRAVVAQALADVLRGTDRLLATHRYGDLLRGGIKTVILGEPNAGKSSLLNRLVGHERALVSAEPGTTRDYLEETILVGPHALRLIDTAGLRADPEAIEKMGIAKTLERAVDADLILWVMDATHPSPTLPPEIVGRMSAENTVVVMNKVDLLAQGALTCAIPSGLEALSVSALTGLGLEALVEAITRRADAFQLLQGEEIIAINARHADALRRARECLLSAQAKLGPGAASELLASDLRGVLDALGEIGGKIDHERMLDHLFATFCIGK
jgi:tRNA modification GTPase